MKKCTLCYIFGGILLTIGCQYRGAIYSQYQQVGIGIRSSPETASPVRVNFGYDRGVIAFVPKLEEGSLKGEAGSLISKNSVSANLSPGAASELLTVDEAFISGNAAIIAAIPDGQTVKFEVGSGESYKVTTKGGSGDRILEALEGKPILTDAEKEVRKLILEINARNDHEQIYDRAAANMGSDFKTAYDDMKKTYQDKGVTDPAKHAFTETRIKLGSNTEKIKSALENAINQGGN